MFGVVVAVVLPILLTTSLGFLWSRLGNRLESKELTALISEISTPCLIISTFHATKIPVEALGAIVLAATSAIAGFAVLGTVMLRLAGLPIRTFLPSIAFPNAGNLGLPLALYAFGPEGLGYAIAFFATNSVFNYTLGQAIAAGHANWAALARLPLLYAVVIAVLIAITGYELPKWLATTLALIGNLTVPLMLLMLGSSLSRLQIGSLGRSAYVAAIRIGGGAAVGIAVAAGFGLTGPMRAVLILQAANPVAVYNYLFAQRWNNQPEEVAGVVVLSTLAAVVTIPLLLTWLLTNIGPLPAGAPSP